MLRQIGAAAAAAVRLQTVLIQALITVARAVARTVVQVELSAALARQRAAIYRVAVAELICRRVLQAATAVVAAAAVTSAMAVRVDLAAAVEVTQVLAASAAAVEVTTVLEVSEAAMVAAVSGAAAVLALVARFSFRMVHPLQSPEVALPREALSRRARVTQVDRMGLPLARVFSFRILALPLPPARARR